MAEIPESIHTVAAKIDEWHEKHQERPRPHMGASLLGHPCDRWLWLSFRWAVVEKFNGRMLRLFRRGQREEELIISDLRAVGMEVHSTGAEQSRVDFGAHVSGSIDGIIEKGVPEAPAKRHVLECKTHSLKSFKALCDKGVQESKPQHWCQMQLYMAGTGIDRALYYAVCKDDDSIYTERVRYDAEAAKALVERGRRLTLCERMPEPLSTDSTWYQCRYCSAHSFCFESKLTKEINCRTCALSTPTEDSKWLCARYGNEEIPVDAQRTGCDGHVLHPDLVPWKWLPSDDGLTALFEIDGEVVKNGLPGAIVHSSKELLGLAGWEVGSDEESPVSGVEAGVSA